MSILEFSKNGISLILVRVFTSTFSSVLLIFILSPSAHPEISKNANNARNYSQCDSLLMGDQCGAHTFPYIEAKNSTAQVEHEATTSKISDDQLFYCLQRGISEEDAINMIVNGFCKEVFKELPMEFAVEAQKLLGITLEGAVG